MSDAMCLHLWPQRGFKPCPRPPEVNGAQVRRRALWASASRQPLRRLPGHSFLTIGIQVTVPVDGRASSQAEHPASVLAGAPWTGHPLVQSGAIACLTKLTQCTRSMHGLPPKFLRQAMHTPQKLNHRTAQKSQAAVMPGAHSAAAHRSPAGLSRPSQAPGSCA